MVKHLTNIDDDSSWGSKTHSIFNLPRPYDSPPINRNPAKPILPSGSRIYSPPKVYGGLPPGWSAGPLYTFVLSY